MADQGNGLGVKMRPRIIDWRCFGSLRAAAQLLTIDRQRQRLEFFGGGPPEADPAPLLRPRLTLGSYADILLALKAGEC